MNNKKTFVLAAALAAALTTWVVARIGDDGQHVMPPLPADAAAAPVTLVEAWPFTLAEGTTHWWRAEQPSYAAGHLLVLAVDRDAVHPRQALEPVLFVGAETAERVNLGSESGYVVAIVPGPADGSALDLASAPIFFGDAALPEELDLAACAAQLDAARALGVAAPPAAAVAAALRETVAFDDAYDLHYFASTLIERYSPVERDLISGLRAPRVGE